jgi:exopolyphosphatase/pppGpp-phosphohydrolase
VADRGLREGILANLMADDTTERQRSVAAERRRS